MLEIKNICKTYRAKSGVEVKALDNVSLTFPETGMVFLLGKSGSGKSTLLNVIGGLDTYDSGEFVIKGKSSNSFHGSDFDSYRNTFIGFIFQEYNILDEFSVGANIGLALQLQGKKASSEKIGELLEQVDLLNFANRKPNELSGGQKQRIAIARALIKEPEIIMADEPTGALDSTTGKQVFDTLKKLSAKKLVLVVSHDRDFAEKYADRIIELSDGKIISDISYEQEAGADQESGISVVSDNLIHIRHGYTLTAEDMKMINAYLAKADKDVLISKNEEVNEGVCNAVGISIGDKGVGKVDKRPTGKVATKQYDGNETKFIRSRLPLKNAIKIGSGSMKKKPIRLLFTILLSVVAFALFGLADTMAAYNNINATVDSLSNSSLSSVALVLNLRHDYKRLDSQGNVEYEYYEYYQSDGINDADLADLKEKTGITFKPVYTGSFDEGKTISLNECVINSGKLMNDNRQTLYPNVCSYGITELTDEDITALGFSLTGTLPTTITQIAITKYHFDMLNTAGTILADNTQILAGALTPNDDAATGILGKSIKLNTMTLQITGIVDTKFDASAYPELALDWRGDPVKDARLRTINERLSSEIKYGFHGLVFAGPGFLEFMPTPEEPYKGNDSDNETNLYWKTFNESYLELQEWNSRDEMQVENGFSMRVDFFASVDIAPKYQFIWLDGGSKTAPEATDVAISANILLNNLKVQKLGMKKATLDGIAFAEESQTPTSYIEYFNNKESLAIACGMATDFDDMTGIEEYRSAVASAMNSKFGVTMTVAEWERYLASGYYHAAINTPMEWLSLKTYLEDSAYLKFMNDHYTEIKSAFDDPSSSFNGWMNEHGGAETHDTSEEVKGYLLTKATEYSKILETGGSGLTPFGGSPKAYFNEYTAAYFRDNADAVKSALPALTFIETPNSADGERKIRDEVSVTGIFLTGETYGYGDSDNIVFYQPYFEALQKRAEQLKAEQQLNNGESEFTYVDTYGTHTSGKYAMAIAAMPEDSVTLENLVRLANEEGENYSFRLKNYVMDTLDMWGGMIETMSQVFLYVGIGFAVFAALMMLNFITASVTAKKREIGVLRAVGARSSDVFAIFFSEALIIAIINFVLATVVVLAVSLIINNALRTELDFALTLLRFSVRQVGLIFGVSVLVALIGSFLPVNSIARKTPVDAMRDR